MFTEEGLLELESRSFWGGKTPGVTGHEALRARHSNMRAAPEGVAVGWSIWHALRSAHVAPWALHAVHGAHSTHLRLLMRFQ